MFLLKLSCKYSFMWTAFISVMGANSFERFYYFSIFSPFLENEKRRDNSLLILMQTEHFLEKISQLTVVTHFLLGGGGGKRGEEGRSAKCKTWFIS